MSTVLPLTFPLSSRARAGSIGTSGWAVSLRALMACRRTKGVVATALAVTSSAVAQDDFPDSDVLFVPDLHSRLYRPSVDAESTLWTFRSIYSSAQTLPMRVLDSATLPLTVASDSSTATLPPLA
jgi:hypothetical protein